jgi:hypothetical protein
LTNRDYGYNIIFAFTLPIVAVIRAMKSKSTKFKHQLLTLLCGIYGSTIVYIPGSDAAVHLGHVTEYYVDMSFKVFIYQSYQILVFESSGGSSDLYKHVLSYICGTVLDMPFLFFTIVGLVYGYFFSGSLLIIFKYFYRTKKSFIFWVIVLIFFTLKNVEGMNTVRTWTGLWILVYACLKYYETKNVKYIILMFVPPFVHFSYFIMAVPAYIVLVIGNRKTVFFSIFVLSFLGSFLTPSAQDVTEVLSQTELGAGRTKAYSVEEQSSAGDRIERAEGSRANWYRAYYGADLQRYPNFLIIIVIFFTGIYSKTMSKVEATLFSIGLLTLTLSNVSWFYFALQNRSGQVGIIFILAAVLLTWQNPSRKLEPFFFKSRLITSILTISLILYVPYVITKISMILAYTSLFYCMTPFVLWISPGLNIGVIEFIKWFI